MGRGNGSSKLRGKVWGAKTGAPQDILRSGLLNYGNGRWSTECEVDGLEVQGYGEKDERSLPFS